MKGLQGERIRQAFRYLDKEGSGYIAPGDFSRIIKEMAAHKLNDKIIERLPTLCQLTAGGRVSYSELRAFINVRFWIFFAHQSTADLLATQVIKEIDLVEIIVRQAITKSRDSRLSRDDFLTAAAQFTRYGVFTPLEADIIFHFAGNQESSRLRLSDFNQLFDAKWEAYSQAELGKHSILHDLGKAIYNFGLGGIAGGIGATAVYPIDLVSALSTVLSAFVKAQFLQNR